MTRFDAAGPESRQELFVDAVTAHRNRASPFLTVEVDESALEDEDLGAPWIQFSDGVVNLDCTDEELDRLKDLLGEFPAFKIDEITRPEDDGEDGGTNVRVSALADPNRIAQFLDAALEYTYDLPDDYRAWVVEV